MSGTLFIARTRLAINQTVIYLGRAVPLHIAVGLSEDWLCSDALAGRLPPLVGSIYWLLWLVMFCGGGGARQTSHPQFVRLLVGW